MTSKTAQLCNQSLSTQVQVNSYRQLLANRNPDSSAEEVERILLAHIEMKKTQCATIEHSSGNNFFVKSASEMILYQQSCPGFNRDSLSQFNCKTSIHSISASAKIVNIQDNDKLIILSSGKPQSATQSYPYSHIGISEHFWLAPRSVPATRSVLITQAYLGTYSHSTSYAVDFGLNEDEEIASTLPGVIIKNSTGSSLHCTKKYGYFSIYKNNIRVSTTGTPCARCYYTSFPRICHSNNAANLVMVSHLDNTFSKYMHLSKTNPHARFGDVVETGQTIGEIGISGWVDGAHLHFETQQAKVVLNNKITFSSIPTHFKPKYPTGQTIFPTVEGRTISVPLSVQAWKEEWHNKKITVTGIASDSANFNCRLLNEVAEAPKDCHFTITGSSYWPTGFNEENIQEYAMGRALQGQICLRQILGMEIETEVLASYALEAQNLPAISQKAFRSISVDISCF